MRTAKSANIAGIAKNNSAINFGSLGNFGTFGN
jgi:hypothetical protein